MHKADDTSSREVTIVIALSSVVPGGVVGHAGMAVDQQYWDFGPKRTDRHQRLMAFNSTAGPWWNDPDQRWQTNRTLDEVWSDLPEVVHPTGSLIAVIRFDVTDQQANAIAAFWDDTYTRMRRGDDRYRLAGRQCASMIGWCLASCLDANRSLGQYLPHEMWMMSPTRLYETLRATSQHTAGPRQGKPADIELWQLGPDGLEPWQRPAVWDHLGMPNLPRTRIAIERFKYLPVKLSNRPRPHTAVVQTAH